MTPESKVVPIQEQVVDDEQGSGLMLSFWRTPDGEGRLRIVGPDLPHGNRDFQFDIYGRLAGTGTAIYDGGDHD